ncbi:DUF2510 domain-containing protein [Protaetiibacter mangrovi]|uniref:DUF2510 domain-containing protein n=1 Tax=Protaetiibacter mangrovi TaxID=2970926 RepID=A0ABT1ZG34_9MICO|nr:DUF2510 domain-containing protein [Protaetiibacter mangrovi]MCS0499678.1 DUF2510 domain-containing protein [Protaetiibacter mangrovi]TPX05334.1 DUF2510 domain-containing protein [Schumannella luteola]
MTDTTASAAAPGWYPDGSGGQRWWDGRGWTEHTAPGAGVAQPATRPALPEGTRVDTVWVWLVALLTLVSSIPIFFFDMTGYMRAVFEAEYSGDTSQLTSAMAGYLAFFAIYGVLGWVVYGFLVFSAFRDYKHLVSVGVERPFHWAFAFIPYAIVYLIGRHVVLRKVTRTAGWPLWAHIGSYVVLIIVSFVWMALMMQAIFAELPLYGDYASFS